MIVQAAARITLDDFKTEHVIPLHRYGDLGRILKAFGIKFGSGYHMIQQGFIDEKGAFYSRSEAAEYMRAHKQTTILGTYPMGDELYSEDLY